MKRTWKTWMLTAAMIGSVAATVGADISFKWAPYVRTRYEYWKNVFDMSNGARDDRGFYRLKLSLWGQMDIGKKYSAYARLTDESRIYSQFDNGSGAYNINEVVFDNLYVDVKNVFDYPVDFRIGRQDLIGLYGEGFLISDGTPNDGSRTFYFNAIKSAWRINEKNTLDAVYMRSYKYDQFPGINKLDPAPQINYSNEDGYMLYHKIDPTPALHVENYFIRKDEWGDGAGFSKSTNQLSTIGSFGRYTFEPFALRGQLAYQFGDNGPLKRAALGGYAYAEANYKEVSLSPQFSAGYVYLSGDDPNTDTVEAFNPLYSRFPWISELYLLHSTNENGIGYWTNIGVAKVTASIAPCSKTRVTFGYNQLYANESLPTAAQIGEFSGGGKDRGSLITGKIDYAISKNITTYLLTEYFKPGKFYQSGSDDALFLRSEVQFKF